MVNGRVYTAPVVRDAMLPYLVVGNYSEQVDNFAGRPGSACMFDLKGYAYSSGGDRQLMELWEECYLTLHRQPLVLGNHLHLTGTLRLLATYLDPDDGKTMQFVAKYEATTRVAGAP